MWLLKPAIVVGVLWYFTQPSGAAILPALGKNCPAGTVSGPWFLCVPATSGGIGIDVVKTSSECDPTSPIYNAARCSASAGTDPIDPLTGFAL